MRSEAVPTKAFHLVGRVGGWLRKLFPVGLGPKAYPKCDSKENTKCIPNYDFCTFCVPNYGWQVSIVGSRSKPPV